LSESSQELATFRGVEYEVFGSSSGDGNCVRVGRFLFDIGVAFNQINEVLYDIKAIFITHIHSDHVRPATLNRIKKLFPNIPIYGNWEVKEKFGEQIDYVVNAGYPVTVDACEIIPFEVPHDVIVYGYTWYYEGQHFIYSTDTWDLKDNEVIANMKFDGVFIEANYDENKLNEVINNTHYGYDVFAGSHRHLSVQESKAFYYLHRSSPDAVWVQLHKSSRFY